MPRDPQLAHRRWRRWTAVFAAFTLLFLALGYASLWDIVWVSRPRTVISNPPVSWMLGLKQGTLQWRNRYSSSKHGWRREWPSAFTSAVIPTNAPAGPTHPELSRLRWKPLHGPVLQVQRLKAKGWEWYVSVDLPLWAPTALGLAGTLASTALWLRTRWRVRRWMCPVCGYDRQGLPEGAACPECGKGAAEPPNSPEPPLKPA